MRFTSPLNIPRVCEVTGFAWQQMPWSGPVCPTITDFVEQFQEQLRAAYAPERARYITGQADHDYFSSEVPSLFNWLVDKRVEEWYHGLPPHAQIKFGLLIVHLHRWFGLHRYWGHFLTLSYLVCSASYGYYPLVNPLYMHCENNNSELTRWSHFLSACMESRWGTEMDGTTLLSSCFLDLFPRLFSS